MNKWKRREAKRKIKMIVGSRSVFKILDIIKKRMEKRKSKEIKT